GASRRSWAVPSPARSSKPGRRTASTPSPTAWRRDCPGRREREPGVTKKQKRMLALMDRAWTLWHIPIMGRVKGRLVRRLIDRYRPLNALELGSLVGYSAILIAGALPPRGRLTCVEQNDFLAHLVKANAEEAGLGKRVKVVVGDAL